MAEVAEWIASRADVTDEASRRQADEWVFRVCQVNGCRRLVVERARPPSFKGVLLDDWPHGAQHCNLTLADGRVVGILEWHGADSWSSDELRIMVDVALWRHERKSAPPLRLHHRRPSPTPEELRAVRGLFPDL